MPKKDSVLVLCAHNDDNIIGVGGTIAKYSKEGIDVISVIFSYGISSHPWLKEQEIIKTRVEESQQADNVVGAQKLYYLGLKEGRFAEEIQKVKDKIARFIKVLKPVKIFTHSGDDPHPDHRAVHMIVSQLLDELEYKGDVYAFDVWNPFNIRNRGLPKLVVDISTTFNKKVQAIKKHRSQWMALAIMIPATYARALINGLNTGVRYAEVFVKIR